MTDMGEIVVGHGNDIENHHALVNIMLQGSDQLTEQENIQIEATMAIKPKFLVKKLLVEPTSTIIQQM